MTAPSLLRGVFAPTLTPLKEDLRPNPDRWIAHCKQLLDDGCHGLVPFGTTSEANSFGVEERMDLLEMLVDAGVSPARLMPGTGLCALPETARLTSHAVELGWAGVLMLPPFYYKDVSDEGLFRSIAEVIERVGDERLRIYLYHIPPIAQVGYSIGLIERLVSAYPEVVVGIKDSSGDWNNLHNILTNFPGFATFTGSERFLIQTLRLGGAGTITAMANVIPRTLRQVYDNWESENAQALQADVDRFREALAGYSPIPALKSIVAFRQSDPTWRTVRPPLVELDEAQTQEVLERCGLCGEKKIED